MSRKLPTDLADTRDFARFSNNRWHELDNFYGRWTDRWRRTIDFIRSLHWRTTREIDLDKLPSWKRYPVINFILSTYSDYMAQWLQTRVRFSAVPDNPLDSADVSSAELADHVLRYLWDRLQVDAVKADLGGWLLSTGNGALRVFWNTNTGNMAPLAMPVQTAQGTQLVPVNPQTLQPDPSMGQPIMVDAGEIGLEALSPSMVRYPSNRAHGVMVGYLLAYDEVVDRYGVDVAEQLKYSKISTAELSMDFLSFDPTPRPSTEDKAMLIEHQIPRSSRFPKGLWWTSSDSQIVVPPRDLPSQYETIIPFRWIPHPGHPTLGLSPLYDMTYSNKAYDEMLARTLEWMNRVIPKILRTSGDGLPMGFFNDEPGQEVPIAQGYDPKWMTTPAPPEQFFKLRSDMTDDLASVGGYKFQQQPRLPGGEATQRFRQPPRMIDDGQQVKLAIINSESSWQRLGYVLLDYAARFYTEPKIVSVSGPDNVYQWREFKGSDLADLPASIHVDKQALYTWNRQSLRDTVIGVLSTPAAQVLFAGEDGQIDRDRINAAMNAAGIDVAPEALDMDIVEAKNEQAKFQSLRPDDDGPKPQSWQNHPKHYAEHVKVVKSVSFSGWPDYQQKAFLQHLEDTGNLISQASEQQKQSVLMQEKALRDIRALAETSQEVRTELGKKLIDALIGVIVGESDDNSNKRVKE